MSNQTRRPTKARLNSGIQCLTQQGEQDNFVSLIFKPSGYDKLSAMIQSTAINIVRLAAVTDKIQTPQSAAKPCDREDNHQHLALT